MADLGKFLQDKKESVRRNNIQGSFMCQECNEVILEAFLDETDNSISWTCSEGHNSRIRL